MDGEEPSHQEEVCAVPLTGGDDPLMQHFIALEEMMQELQTGFVSAMTELSKIQDEDRELHHKVESSRKEQDAQISDVVEIVQSLKIQFDHFQSQMEMTNKNQKSLENQIQSLKSEREVLLQEVKGQHQRLTLENLDQAYSQSDDKYTSPMLKPFIASLPSPEELKEPNEADLSDNSDNSVTEATEKSIRLTNLLAQKIYNSSRQQRADESDRSSILSSKSGSKHETGYLQEIRKRPPHQLHHQQVQRRKVVQSLVESERGYCTSLWDITENYKKVFTNTSSFSSMDTMNIFPPCLERMYEFHCGILKLLEQRLSKWKNQDIIGDIFARFSNPKHMDIFSLYNNYIENFAGAAVRTINKLNKTSKRFQKLLRQGQTGQNSSALITLLMSPIRIISTYVEQLQQLLKYTDSDHPDHYNLETSLKEFNACLKSMNETMERSIQKAASDSNSSRRSLETCSWSSHEEDQRMSTATKDSGIHSNGEDQHEELSPHHTYQPDPQGGRKFQKNVHRIRHKRMMGGVSPVEEEVNGTQTLPRNSKLRSHTLTESHPRGLSHVTEEGSTDGSPYNSPRRRTSGLIRSSSQGDLRTNTERPILPQRSETPSIEVYNRSRREVVSPGPGLLRHMAHSTPDLLDETSTEKKVQFRIPPEENSTRRKRDKRRSIADTLKRFFIKRRLGIAGKFNGGDMPDCDTNSTSFDDTPRPAPPEMFANNSPTDKPATRAAIYDDCTYEDENGDPYTAV